MANGLTLRSPAPTAGFLGAYTQALFGGMRERRLQEATDLQSLVREAQLAKIRRDQEEEERRRLAMETALGPASVGAVPSGAGAPLAGGMPSVIGNTPVPSTLVPAGQPADAAAGIPFSQFTAQMGPANAARIIGSPEGRAIMQMRGVVSDEEHEARRRKVQAATELKEILANADQLMMDKKPVESKFLRASGYRKVGEAATVHSERLDYFRRADELLKEGEALASDKEEAQAYGTVMSQVRQDMARVLRDPSDPAALFAVVDTLLASPSKTAHKDAYGMILERAKTVGKHPTDPDLAVFSQVVMRHFAVQPPGSQDLKAAERAARDEIARADPALFSRVFYKLTFGDKPNAALAKDLFEIPPAPKTIQEQAAQDLKTQGVAPGHPEFPQRFRVLVNELKREESKAAAEGREAARTERPAKPETAASLTIALDRLRREQAALTNFSDPAYRSDLTEEERAQQVRELDEARALTIREYVNRAKQKAPASEAAPERSRTLTTALEEGRKVWARPDMAKKSDADKAVSVRNKLKMLKFGESVIEQAVDVLRLPPGTVNPSVIGQVKDAMAKTNFGKPYEQLDAEGRAAVDADFDRSVASRMTPSGATAPATAPPTPSTRPAAPAAPVAAPPPTGQPTDKKARAIQVMGELFPGRTWEQLTPQEKQQIADRIR